MRGDSYTLREVSELLGVSKRTLQRRIREGAFPGRFLAPGRHGLETRIPAEDVERALDEIRRGGRPPALEAGLTEMRLPTVTPARELEEHRRASIVTPSSLTHRDLETLRDAVLAIVREDRESLVAVIRETMESREKELSAVRSQLSTILTTVERIRARVEAREEKPLITNSPDGDDILRDIEELETLLGRLQH